MNLSLAKIGSFIAVAEAGQFRKAAEKIGVSQAALSSQIRDLEEHLAVTLFSRTTRSVRLTAEGERFLHSARKIVNDLAEAVADVRDKADLKRGRLIIAATPSVAANILPTAIVAFKARFPGIQIQLAEAQSSGVEQRVEIGLADFGVGPKPSGRVDFSFSFLQRDRFVGVVATNHPLAKRKSIPLAQLLEYPLLTTTPESSIHSSLHSVLTQRGIALPTEHLISQHHTVVAMVAAGLGVALLPSLAFGSSVAAGIVLLKVIDPEIARDIGIFQRKGGSVSSAADAFVRQLTQERNEPQNAAGKPGAGPVRVRR